MRLAAPFPEAHDDVVADRCPETGGELLESPPSSTAWRARWAALPRRRRRLVAAAAALLLTVAGAARLREHLAERAAEQRVVLAVSLGVEASDSISGGRVDYFLRVRNDGSRPVSVMSLRASAGRVRLQLMDGGRLVDAGREAAIPISVLLTCATDGGRSAGPPPKADLVIRRADGGSVSERIALRPATVVPDVAATLCRARPELHDYELSGPIVRAG